MTGVQAVLGALGGIALGIAVTALRWAVVRRLAPPPPIPPSAEVLEAERRQTTTTPLTDRRTR